VGHLAGPGAELAAAVGIPFVRLRAALPEELLPGALASATDIDGIALGPTTMGDWRERIGAVMQDDYLLTGTLGDNICFFHPQPDQAAIENVARFALIHDDIAKMPMAYSSLVSDMGTTLSSGQRQRILHQQAFADKIAVDGSLAHGGQRDARGG
jgi:ABC-type transport system involved in cytochrome bd biosynthesis fused ATPase/permease subunit